MRLRSLTLLLALASLCSCAATYGGDLSRGRLGQLARAPLFTDLKVEQVAHLEPQLPRPFRLGIAPPFSAQPGGRARFHGPGYATHARPSGSEVEHWTPAEEALLARSTERLLADGLVSEVVRIPRSLLPAEAGVEAGPQLLEALRVAAARLRVDAVLVIHRATNLYVTNSPLALLDLTIVGAAVCPAYKVHAQSALEGLVIDARNEYLYLSGAGYAEDRERTAAYFVQDEARDLLRSTRLEALENLAEDLLDALAAGGPASTGGSGGPSGSGG